MDIDEVEMQLTQPEEEEDIVSALSPEMQEIDADTFVLRPVAWERRESSNKSVEVPKTPTTPKITSTFPTPPRPHKNTEPSPMPLFVLGPSVPTSILESHY